MVSLLTSGFAIFERQMQPAFRIRLRSSRVAFKTADFRILRQGSLADADALTGLGPDGGRLSSEPGIQRTGRRSSLRHCPPNRILASPLVRDGPLSAPSLQIHQTTSNTRMATCLNDLTQTLARFDRDPHIRQAASNRRMALWPRPNSLLCSHRLTPGLQRNRSQPARAPRSTAASNWRRSDTGTSWRSKDDAARPEH